MQDSSWRWTKLKPQHNNGGLRYKLIYVFSLYQFEALSFSVEQTFEVSIWVGVYIVLFQYCEACILNNGIFERANFELMCAFCEVAVGVYPGEEAGNIRYFGEGDHCLVELYLRASDELALEDAVVELAVQHLLACRGESHWTMLAEDGIEIGQHFAVETVDCVAEVIVAFIYTQQNVIVVSGEVVADETADIRWTFSQFETFANFFQAVHIHI